MKSASLVVSLFALVPATSSAFMHSNNSPLQRNLGRQNKVPHRKTHLNNYRSVEEAIADAKQVCAEEGPNSQRCAVAWDIVEELEAADSHVRTPTAGANELSYVPLVQGFDILTSKMERKLGELKSLSTQMAEAGAGPEVERLIYASDEMTQVIQEARAAMSQYS